MEKSVASQITATDPPSTLNHQPSTHNKLCGLVTRKERWGPSRAGWFLLATCFLAGCWLLLLGAHSFLAVTARVDTNVLVVEGWINPYAIRVSAAEFKAGTYERAFTTGGPGSFSGGYVNDYQTGASVGAELLVKAGLPALVVQMVPSHVIGRDRTYSSAVALRDWFREHNLAVRGINVVTEDAHARRTRLLFQKAFGDGVQVGIISVQNPDYDPKRWWRYSEGVREVVGESVAYLYARLFFWPSAHAD